MLKTDTRQANWRRANPAKYDAHLAVQRAVKAGELEKQTCEVCGGGAVDAHHDRYDEPLKVRWLCRLHHTRLHNRGEDMFPIRLRDDW
jgi:ribosomal protein S27AE